MPEAVIVEAVRSPVGKRNGGLSGVHPAELSAQVLNGLATRAGIDPGIVDDVIWGCVMQAGEQALDIGRTALLTAGWPETVPGVTVGHHRGIHGAGRGPGYGLDREPRLLEQPVEHPPGEGAVRAAALQGEVDQL